MMLFRGEMSVVHDITNSEFSEIDAFLNAEASQAKELGLEPDTTIEAFISYASC